MQQKRENYSKKRTAILSALRASTAHPTAEQIYTRLRPQYPNLSLGTVYRNLRLFCRNGQAQSVGVIRGQERFDPITAPHVHLLCDRCGALRDVESLYFGQEEMQKVSARTGLQVRGASVLLYGLCRECAGARQEAESAEEAPRLT